MDKFVEDAFNDAINAELGVNDEFFKRFSEMANNRADNIMETAGKIAGMESMEVLSMVVFAAKLQDTFAKFVHAVSLLSYYEGYKAKEQEGK